MIFALYLMSRNGSIECPRVTDGRRVRAEGEQTAPPSPPPSSPSTDSVSDADDACYAPIFAATARGHFAIGIGMMSRKSRQAGACLPGCQSEETVVLFERARPASCNLRLCLFELRREESGGKVVEKSASAREATELQRATTTTYDDDAGGNLR